MRKIIASTIVIAVLGLLLGGINVVSASTSSVILDVNPSIEIVTNRLSAVTEVKALNDDAREMLKDYVLKDKNIDNVVNELIDLMIDSEYITGGEDNVLMLTVYEENADKEVLRRMNNQIKAYLENKKIAATILNQVTNRSDDDKDEKTYSGKRDLINKIVSNDDKLNYDDLALVSIKDIMIISENMGIAPEELFLKVVQTAKQSIFEDDNSYITPEEARNIAKDITNYGQIVKFKIDKDDSKTYYEIEVINASREYEIKIDALTGQIVKFELDEKNSIYDRKLISVDEAIKIATEISGSGEVEIELDEDDDEYVYEIEVRNKTGKYEIEINAVTGEVIKSKIEKTYEQNPGKFISKEDAKTIALVKSKGGKVKEIELDEDDGRYAYEIEIEKSNLEYKFKIDAVSGEILKMEIDD